MQACSDPRLPHRIADWARTHNATPTQSDADSIVAWLRQQRGSEYARKPAEGLKRQVLRHLSDASKGGSSPAALPAPAASSISVSWSIDPAPSNGAGTKRPSSEPTMPPREKAARPEGSNLLNASIRASYSDSAQAEGDAPAEAAAAGAEEGEAAAATATQAASSSSAAAAPAADGADAAGRKPRGRERRQRGRRDGEAGDADGAGGSGGGGGGGIGGGGTVVQGLGYADLGGMDGVLQEVRELVEYPLTHPEIYTHLGVDPPRGLLLHGPPGCGKTLLASAIAGELGVQFFKVSAPEVVSGMSGESEAKIRSLFKEAREAAPALLFIDEIDAIAPSTPRRYSPEHFSIPDKRSRPG